MPRVISILLLGLFTVGARVDLQSMKELEAGMMVLSDAESLKEHDVSRIKIGTLGSRIRLQSGLPGEAQESSEDLVSMDFQNAPLRAVLRTLAELSSLNIVIDPQVEGVVDVSLTDVPLDEALRVVLRSNQLGSVVEGKIVRIAPLDVLAKEEEQIRVLAKSQTANMGLVVMTRALSYARAKNMRKLIKGSVLSSRGKVEIDERTNTVIVRDLEARVSAIGKLLDTLDRAEPQVQIEARIVRSEKEFGRLIGINWSRGSRVEFSQVAKQKADRGEGLVGDASSVIGLTMGSVEGISDLNSAISEAENDGRLRLLSQPLVTTQNNLQVEIVQGEQIPIQVVSNSRVSVQYEDAVLVLRVTPQITEADTVIMEIEINNKFADFDRKIEGMPPIVTQGASTTVQVASGETTVIGGIFEGESSRGGKRVSLLRRIPLLGWLFKDRSEQDSSEELLIFLTATVIR